MDESQAWIEKLGDLRDAGRACVMVVVTEVRGSAPREPGTRMLVADGQLAWGTIGGGNLEKQALEHATELLARLDGSSESVDYPLAEKTGQRRPWLGRDSLGRPGVAVARRLPGGFAPPRSVGVTRIALPRSPGRRYGLYVTSIRALI